MKLDVTQFRYITKEEFRVLTAVEMCMRNHEYVPVTLIESIAKINRGSCYKLLQNLLRNKLLGHDGKKYDGYRLTYGGYDYLALRALAARGSIVSVGRRLGVGKESDVHFAQGPNGEMLALKLHRLGRVSFRAIKSKRDYLQGRAHASWMYMARLAAIKEFAYMKALGDEGFPVPKPVDQNRHVVVMHFIQAVPFYHVRSLSKPHSVLERLMRLVVRLARAGVVHGDFNEFNLMIDKDEKVTLIDFPQIVHMNHPNAEEFFDRDVKGVCDFFRKRLGIEVEDWPSWQEAIEGATEELEAKGPAESGSSAAILRGGKIEGLDGEEDNMLLAAHSQAKEEGEEGEDDSDDDEGEEDKEDADDKGAKVHEEKFENLLGEGGRSGIEEEPLQEALFQPPSRATAAAAEGAADAPATQAASAVTFEEEGEEAEESDSEESQTSEVGQVEKPGGKRIRRKHTAKDARKNLQKQQKQKPARANNSKLKDLRKAKSEIKEWMNG